MKRKLLFAGLILALAALPLAACAAPAPAPVEPITLKALALSPLDWSGQHWYKIYCNTVVERSNGELIIDLAGPEVIPLWDQHEACRTGVIDMNYMTNGMTEVPVPEISAWDLTERFPWEERENGAEEWIQSMWEEKLNVHYLGRMTWGTELYQITNVYVERLADLEGQKIAGYGSYQLPTEAVGGEPIMMPTSDRYTGLERGVIDGVVAFPSMVIDYKWHEIVDYYVDHGVFGGAGSSHYINLDTWNSLPKHLQDLMTEVQIEIEPEMVDWFIDLRAQSLEEMQAEGMEPLHLPADEAEWYVNEVKKLAWERVEELAGKESADKLKSFLIYEGYDRLLTKPGK